MNVLKIKPIMDIFKSLMLMGIIAVALIFSVDLLEGPSSIIIILAFIACLLIGISYRLIFLLGFMMVFAAMICKMLDVMTWADLFSSLFFLFVIEGVIIALFQSRFDLEKSV